MIISKADFCYEQLEIRSSELLDPAPKPVPNQTLLSIHPVCLGAEEKAIVQLSF